MIPRVMVVDDEPRMLEALRRTLQRQGYSVVCARGAEVALDRLESEAIDVVISDENMPGMRGVELLARVARRWPSTVRIMLTGQSDSRTVLRAINNGHVHRFCLKPCDGESLLTAIEKCLRQTELELASLELLRVTRSQTRLLEDIERRIPGSTDSGKSQRDTPAQENYQPGQVVAQIREVLAEVEGNTSLGGTGRG